MDTLESTKIGGALCGALLFFLLLNWGTEVIYHSVNKRKKKIKTNQIVFVGKLNHSKGYDIYKDAIIKFRDLRKEGNRKVLIFGCWKDFFTGLIDRKYYRRYV